MAADIIPFPKRGRFASEARADSKWKCGTCAEEAVAPAHTEVAAGGAGRTLVCGGGVPGGDEAGLPSSLALVGGGLGESLVENKRRYR